MMWDTLSITVSFLIWSSCKEKEGGKWHSCHVGEAGGDYGYPCRTSPRQLVRQKLQMRFQKVIMRSLGSYVLMRRVCRGRFLGRCAGGSTIRPRTKIWAGKCVWSWGPMGFQFWTQCVKCWFLFYVYDMEFYRCDKVIILTWNPILAPVLFL